MHPNLVAQTEIQSINESIMHTIILRISRYLQFILGKRSFLLLCGKELLPCFKHIHTNNFNLELPQDSPTA